MGLKIDPEFKELIPPLTKEEKAQLETNIINEGIREAIIVCDNTIIDGHNRYDICTRHAIKYETREIDFESREAAKEWIIKNQFGRRNLSNYDRSVLALKLKDLFAAKAKETQGIRNDILEKSPRSFQPINTRVEIAKIAQVSDNTIHKVERIEKSAPAALKAQVQRGDISINQAYQKIKGEIKKQERLEDLKKQEEAIKTGAMPELKGLFDVIAIDPPWPYGREYDPETSRVANPYPEMSLEEISKIELPVKEDGILWLWTTHQFLPAAFDLLKKWDFNYKATLVWNKEKIGMGAWLRMQCEFCLLAVKGKPFWNNTTVRDILNSPRREHSRKPDEFYEMVNQICLGRKLEYFSREPRQGWEVFGNDVSKFQRQNTN